MIELDEFIYFDDNEMIERFKELISPDNEKYYKIYIKKKINSCKIHIKKERNTLTKRKISLKI